MRRSAWIRSFRGNDQKNLIIYCHNNSYAHHSYFDIKGADSAIPLSGNSKKVSVPLPGRDEVRLDGD